VAATYLCAVLEYRHNLISNLISYMGIGWTNERFGGGGGRTRELLACGEYSNILLTFAKRKEIGTNITLIILTNK
jgi:hypothetical protein